MWDNCSYQQLDYSGLSIQRTAWDNRICPLYGSVLNLESIIRIPYKH